MASEWRGALAQTLGSGDGLYRVGGGAVLHSDLANVKSSSGQPPDS
jgi:hypothetical protein